MISALRETIIVVNSPISRSPTLNFSKEALKSEQKAFHSCSVMFIPLWLSRIDLPVYCWGPPVAMQTISVTRNFNPVWGCEKNITISAYHWDFIKMLFHDLVAQNNFVKSYSINEVIYNRSYCFLATKPVVEGLKTFEKVNGLPLGVHQKLRYFGLGCFQTTLPNWQWSYKSNSCPWIYVQRQRDEKYSLNCWRGMRLLLHYRVSDIDSLFSAFARYIKNKPCGCFSSYFFNQITNQMLVPRKHWGYVFPRYFLSSIFIPFLNLGIKPSISTATSIF